MGNYLFLSLPESHDFKIYQEDTNGDIEISFSEFFNKNGAYSFSVKETNEIPKLKLESWPITEVYNYSKDKYLNLLEDTIHEIRKKSWGKVVISRAQDFEFDGDPFQVYKELVKIHPSACVYFLIHDKLGIWMGATPESLITGLKGKLTTMSLAGTRVAGEENSFEPKEEHEQELVTNYIISRLKDIKGVSEIELGTREKLKAGNIYHFLNRIEAKYSNQFRLEDFFDEFHPTPAVGGFPKKEAIQFIKENEKHNRSLYTGYFGIKNKSEFAYFVNLRCMQLFKDKAVLYAGGGITADSIPEKEWEETNAKMKTLLSVIGSSKS